MNENINLRDIKAFKSISNSSIEEIKNDIKILKYKLGSPICDTKTIPNRILIILFGEARIVNENTNNTQLVSKLGKHEFIGLASILRAKGCELISASGDLIGLSLSDKLVIKLYQEEESFRLWCNEKIHISEIYQLSNHLYEDVFNSKINKVG